MTGARRRALLGLLGLVSALLAVVALAWPAAASPAAASPAAASPAATPATPAEEQAQPARQADGGEAVRGRVFNEFLEDGETVREPVPDVAITITLPDGAPAGEATTGPDGSYEVAVPGPGEYVLTLDEETLPEGVAMAEGGSSRAISINPGQRLVGNFFLGEDTRTVASRWDRLPQSIFDGLFFGLIIAIASVGLSLIYGTTGLSNFAHGELVTFGAVMAMVANRSWGLHLLIAAPIAIAFGVAGGYAFDRGVWSPLRRRRVGLTSQMIASIGLALFFRYLIQYLFGARTQFFRQYQGQTNPIEIGPVRFPPRVAFSIVVCLVVLLAVAAFLLRTRFGKAVRAVADNPDLASATGINTNRIIAIVWMIGGGLAALGGVLVGLDQAVSWDRGATILLLMFAAITLGGLGSAFAALVGSLVIGLAVELSAWLFPDYIDLKRTGALIVLILVLLVRPQGILGTRERIG
ncbi:MAG: branched-chain amino acid ABC transporter permease [Acidimicrobiales bacterium]